MLESKEKYFSELVDEYFIRWIGIDTWYTKHHYDRKRFYKFIRAIQKFSKKEYSAEEIENRIKKAVISYHCNFNREELDKIAKELSFIVTICLEYSEVGISPYYDIKGYLDKIIAKRNSGKL